MPLETVEEGGKEFVKIPREEFERWKATVELAEDSELQEKLAEARSEYEKGKTREWSEASEGV